MTQRIRTYRHPAVQVAYREMLEPSMMVTTGGIAVAVVLLFVLVGPLGTDILSPGARAAYWILCAVFALPISYATTALALFLFRSRPVFWLATLMAATQALLSACAATIVFTFRALLWPQLPVSVPAFELYGVCATAMFGAAALMMYIVFERASKGLAQAAPRPASTDSGASGGGREAGGGGPVASPTGPGTGSVQTRARAVSPQLESRSRVALHDSFVSRLPATMGSDIVYLKVDGHYIEVYTTQGSAVMLASLTDTVAALAGRGMQVHRSYWVAHQHVLGVVRRDTRTMLRLTGGHRVPVSRTYVPGVNSRYLS